MSDEKHDQAERHLRDRLNEKYPDALAAVRADERKKQIEKDARVAERRYPLGSPVLGDAPSKIANAIRAQLTEGENDE